jgi:phage terminase large subunit-like protein
MMNLTPEEYCDVCWDKVKEYTVGIDDGSIVVGNYIKKVRERYALLLHSKDRYVFRKDRVEKVFKFFSYISIEHKNKYRQIDLMPWQCFILSMVFGLYYVKDNEKRVFREVFLFIARKSGKTAFSAAIQLYGMLADGVAVPQSLLLANTAQQATVALNLAKDMLIHSPALKKRLMGQRSRIIFKDFEKQGFCQIFSTVDSARLEGYSPSMCIMDEIHGWTDNTIYQAVKTGIGARQNPLMMIITTAGNKNNGFCNEYLKYHKDVLDGNIEDESSIGFIYQPDEYDDLADSQNWLKANPSVGTINKLEDLITTFKQAVHSYADKYAFITKHLNIFWDTPDVWIPEDNLTPLFSEFDESKLLGKNAFLGLDLSRTTDLSSVVLIVPVPEEDLTYVIPYFYLANREENVIRKNGKDLSNWIFDGKIKKCSGSVIDLDQIYTDIIELSQRFNIVEVAYDPYNAPQLISKLKEYGLICTKFAQTAMKFNAPLKSLEEKIYNQKIRLKNEVLLWNFLNVVLYIDGNANIKIIKNKKNDSVDGVVALAMAYGAFIENTYGEEIMGLTGYLDAIKNAK